MGFFFLEVVAHNRGFWGGGGGGGGNGDGQPAELFFLFSLSRVVFFSWLFWCCFVRKKKKGGIGKRIKAVVVMVNGWMGGVVCTKGWGGGDFAE